MSSLRLPSTYLSSAKPRKVPSSALMLASGLALFLALSAHAQPPNPPPGQGPPNPQGPAGHWTRDGDDLYYLDGNVGIGTTDPTTKLMIEETGTGASPMLVLRRQETGTESFQGVVFRLDPTNALFHLDVVGTGNSHATILLGDADASANDVTTLGNVGIGTTAPTTKLMVEETGTGPSPMFVLRRREAGTESFQGVVFRLDPTNALFHLDVGGTGNSGATIHLGDLEAPVNDVTMLGDVGIGTRTPRAKLDVEGTMQATALELRAGGDLVSLSGTRDRKLLLEGDAPAMVIRDTMGTAARLELLERESDSSGRGAVLLWNGETDKLVIGSTRNDTLRQGITLDDSTGYIGIGTGSPEAALHVRGTARASHLHVVGTTRTSRLEQLAAPGDKISLYGDRFGQTNMYGFGVDNFTLYYKANGNHRWFVNANAHETPTMNLSERELILQAREPVLQLRDNSGDNSSRAARLELLEHAGGNFDGGAFLWWNGDTNRLLIGTENGGASNTVLSVDRSSAGVGIGTEDPGDYRLAVNGAIRAKEVVVETGWADFVFEDDYPLRSLSELEDYVVEHGHLPEMPSSAEVAERGVSLGDMQARLLRTIEEMALYLMKLQQDIDKLSADNHSLRTELNSLRGAPRRILIVHPESSATAHK